MKLPNQNRPSNLRRSCVRDGRVSKAFTLLEVLIAITIIGVLLAILMPAVQAARESARAVQCQSQLKQLGIAMHSFHAQHRRLPTNGWGYEWLGLADRGFGRDQPGGWIYQLLPQLEATPIFQLSASNGGLPQSNSLIKMARTPLPLLRCPSRPGSQREPQGSNINYRLLTAQPVDCSRTDYAINEGDFISNTGAGPATLANGVDPYYAWKEMSSVTGVSWQRGSTSFNGISDGLSHTYLLGEKRVSRLGYEKGSDPGHDQSPYTGVDLDNTRWVTQVPRIDGPPEALDRHFGSAHPSGCFMLMCDGSVQMRAYTIHPDVHRHAGNRKDADGF